jgi:hypothetical protein
MTNLEGEVVRSSCRSCVDLNSSRLHGITDQNCLVDIFCEHTALQK